MHANIPATTTSHLRLEHLRDAFGMHPKCICTSAKPHNIAAERLIQLPLSFLKDVGCVQNTCEMRPESVL